MDRAHRKTAAACLVVLLGLGATAGLADAGSDRGPVLSSLALYVATDAGSDLPRAGVAAIANILAADMARQGRPLFAITPSSPTVRRAVAEGELPVTDLEPPLGPEALQRLCGALDVEAALVATIRHLSIRDDPALVADLTWADVAGRQAQRQLEIAHSDLGASGPQAAAALAELAAARIGRMLAEMEHTTPRSKSASGPEPSEEATEPTIAPGEAASAEPGGADATPAPPEDEAPPKALEVTEPPVPTVRPTEEGSLVGRPPTDATGLAAPEKGRRTAPPGEATYRRALQAIQEGDYAEAAALLHEALAAEGEVAEYRMLLGDALSAMGRPGAAEREYARAIGGDPGLALPHLRLGQLHAQRGLWQKAVREFELALESDPQLLEARIRLADVYLGQNLPRESLRELRQAAAIAPGNVDLMLRIADVYRRLDDRDAAEGVLAGAALTDDAEGRVKALFRLGELYSEEGEHMAGFLCYAQAMQLGMREPRRVLLERYGETMAAADAAVRESLAHSRSIYTDYQEKKITREQAHEQFRQQTKALEKLIRSARSIPAPAQSDKRHKERLVAYQHANEGDTDMLSFFDYGDETWRDFALELWEQARVELEQVSGVTPQP